MRGLLLLLPLLLIAAAAGERGIGDDDEEGEAVGPPSREGGTAEREVGVEGVVESGAR